MYHNRVKKSPGHRCWYLITNRVVGGSFVFGDIEKEKLRRLLFDGQNRMGYKVWDYVILDNHYHCLIEICDAEAMSREEVLDRWRLARGGRNVSDPGDAVLDNFRLKIHDVSFVVSNFQQRFTQWFNRKHKRWGRLFGGRFDSVIVDADTVIARVMAYITLNPVRAGIVVDPAEYRWCGYAERMANGLLQPDDRRLAPCLKHELGLSDKAIEGTDTAVLNRTWARFRKVLLGRTVQKRSIDGATIAEVLNRQNKPLELSWPQRLMLRARFVTKGIAIGSRKFAEEIAIEGRAALCDSKPRRPHEARAWDGYYSLRNHRRWIG